MYLPSGAWENVSSDLFQSPMDYGPYGIETNPGKLTRVKKE
jgi:hypothetical protein